MLNPQSQRSRSWAVPALALTMLLSSLGTSIANVGLPAIAQDFGASFSVVQWIVIAYLLTVTALVVSAGRLGDLFGRRRLLLGGIGLFAAASLLCGIAPTVWLLIAARVVQGAGAAVMMALAMGLAGAAVPEGKAGRAMGLLGTMSAVGTAIGPSLGGALIAASGWRGLFLAQLPLAVLAFLLVRAHLGADRPRQEADKPRFDIWGTILLVLSLSAYALAMSLGRGRFGITEAALLSAAGVSALLFAKVQRRSASPLVQLSLFRDPTLVGGLAATALVSTVMMSTLVVGPFYLSRALGLDPLQVGLILSVGPAVAALASVPAGRLTDRHGAPPVALTGLLAVGIGCLFLATMPSTLGVTGYLGSILLVTFGYALFQTANNTAVMVHLAGEGKGVVAGLLTLSRNLGLVSGASLIGAIFAAASSSTELPAPAPEAAAAGLRAAFAFAAALILAAIAIVIAGSRRPRVARAAS